MAKTNPNLPTRKPQSSGQTSSSRTSANRTQQSTTTRQTDTQQPGRNPSSAAAPSQKKPSATPEINFYFAYNSYMSSSEMQKHCPTARAVRLAYLKDWKYIINNNNNNNNNNNKGGHSNLVHEQGSGAYGVVWHIEDSHKEALRRYGGQAGAYQPRTVQVRLLDDALNPIATLGALAYVDPAGAAPGTPSDGYARRMGAAVTEARQRWSLPEYYAEKLERAVGLDSKAAPPGGAGPARAGSAAPRAPGEGTRRGRSPPPRSQLQ